ncbi:MAG: 50S ribosomal protein L25 [Candidatus Wallbacteria bacterium HGW-Wallbacteria-1]|jgi:large subunit ribosomal protein L25|uniref:Large ribosomal subunit protein bL25 n=1 Tax=Candidatus Wallbacteria bacterium HGW-Wallbacteria-1 TaxID=2013854 RepID=A0A2N1PS97_9BACT|nr:MAG: 50S ribosomal protein L25 [Candidatus Wallbacteria bacterium HGW-Wallbacteria-1]
MSEVILKGFAREKMGSSAARAIRAKGFIPSVIYSHGEEPINFSIDTSHYMKEIGLAWKGHGLLKIDIDGKGTFEAMIKDIQISPINRQVNHIDFYKITRGEKIISEVPVILIHQEECAGAKLGGIIEQMVEKVRITVLPSKLPSHIEIDVASLQIGASLNMKHLNITEDVEILEPMTKSVVRVKGKKVL